MNPSDDNQPGHAPIYSKKRKTATRSRKKETKRPGGVATLVNLFEPKSDISKDEGSKSNANVTSSYAISSHGEVTDVGEGLALRPRSEGSTSDAAGKDNPPSGDGEDPGNKSEQEQSSSRDDGSAASDSKPISDKQETEEKDKTDDRKLVAEYSAEARTYHAFYDELQRAHLRGHYTWCRDACLKLLVEPRIPLWTRIQTLQLLSTMLQPAGAEQCLREADQVLDKLNPDHFQTRLLRDDNRKMKLDRDVWRLKKDLVGKDIEGVDEAADEGPSEAYFKLDRELDANFMRELEEEMVPRRTPDRADVEMADVGKAGMPSPASSKGSNA